jgi:hypothetical protein
MTNSNFGFEAIDNRFKIVGGKPLQIEEKFKINLTDTLNNIFGVFYEKDGEGGKLYNLSLRNKMKPREFLTGEEEAKCFNNKEWLKLHNSTLCKVKLFKFIIEKTYSKKLKVKSNVFEIYGISVKGLNEIINNNIYLKIVWWVVLMILGFIGNDIYSNI